jgi:GWxTD domain-containing protein
MILIYTLMPARTTIILTALITLISAAAGQPAPERIPFRLDADAARYSGSDSLTYVEIYYGIPEAGLTYVPAPGGGLGGAVELRLRVSDSSGTVASRDWVLPRLLEDSAGLAAQRNILSFESLALREGEYRVWLFGRDSVDPSRADSVGFPLRAGTFAGRGEAVSDIELCSRITPSTDTASAFYRNTMEVIPNPSRLYGEGLPVLWFYTEVYNLDLSPGPDVLFRASITDSRGQEVAVQSKRKPRAHRSSVEYGSMNVASLPGGSYLFRIDLVDTAGGGARALASSGKKFFVYRPGGEGPAAAAPASDRTFSFMTEQEADDELRRVEYIASEPERRQMERLPGLPAKRNFLRDFWASRDAAESPDGGTARDRYLGLIREADRQFTRQGSEGWRTDRGRVMVVYGTPDNIERHPSTSETHPYEVWEYQALQGGVVFVFVDRMGFGAYRLVHSTHISELRNDNWYQDEAVIR